MFKNKFYKRNSCRICESEKLDLIFELPETPPGNNLLKQSELNLKEDKFPLK